MARISLRCGVSGSARNESFKYVGDAAKEGLFGANFLYNRDGGQQAGTISNSYREFASETNVQTLRYPGGTITEVYLDLKNPNSIAQTSGQSGQTSEPSVPLSTFLDFAANINATGTIVLPTYRLLSDQVDASGNRLIDSFLTDDLRSYVRFSLTEAERLGTSISAFEVGNEWYVDNTASFGFVMSPIEYGRVAAYLSEIVEQEIAAHLSDGPANPAERPAIVIQVGPGGAAEWYTTSGEPVPDDFDGQVVSATELIFRQFTNPDACAAVDGILVHRFLHGTDSNITGWAYNTFDIWSKLVEQSADFKKNPDRFVTEWNVSSRNDTELGLKHFDTMVELIEEMMLSGVDHANVWAVQQRNPTRLINNSGIGNEAYGGLSFAGAAFDMMSAQLQGTRVLSGPFSTSGLAVNVFGSDQKLVYFLTNRSEENRIDELVASELKTLGRHVAIYKVTEGLDGDPAVSVSTVATRSLSANMRLEFLPNESMMIVVARGKVGTSIEGYDLPDALTGSLYADSILGGNGADTIDGSSGNDTLNGEAGGDQLDGGWGNDIVDGGTGNDVLHGGAGNDTLIGGPGLDTIYGGAGVDVVSFGSTTAALIIDMDCPAESSQVTLVDLNFEIEGFLGGSGADHVFGNAESNILGGGVGNDWLVGRAGNDTLFGNIGQDCIFGGDGKDIIYGGDGDDTLNGGPGNDKLYGESGTDTASYLDAVSGVTANLGTKYSQVKGGGGRDVLINIENLIGSVLGDKLLGNASENRIDGDDGNDKISGGSSSDTLFGGVGDDTLFGNEGDDIIVGGEGKDMLNGGQGADLFVFRSIFGGGDIITDFNGLNGGDDEGDRLRFEGFGVADFEYLGDREFTGGLENSEARVSGNQLQIDTNGDGIVDIWLNMSGLVGADMLSTDDFVFV